jgi:uncharacterized protein YkwD
MHPRSLLIFSTIAFVLIGFALQYNLVGKRQTDSPTVLASTSQNSLSPTQTLTHTPTMTTIQTPKPSTPKALPTSGDLMTAVNTYRQSQGISSLGSSSTLCSIASVRASQQQQIGHLDHSGFNAAAQAQSEFKGLAEILQTNSNPKDATFLVQSGWANSPGHNATLLDKQWTHGCGSMAGNFAVFIFARK